MNKVSSRICLLLAAIGFLAGNVTAYADTSSMSISAQQSKRTVTGIVLDAKDFPLEGVAVIQDGTTNGVMTGADGTFTISLPGETTSVTVSCLGYATKTVSVPSGQGYVKIYLTEDSVALEETVVVGYGTQKKVNLTGAIATISSDDLENRTSSTLTHMLMGTTPGLNITMSSGRPGNAASINIRGITSINGGSPLVLVDGAEGDLSKVNPGDVESISVVKDASAAAIYGARASFGVVLVTTKSGKSKDGKATVRYSGRFGWSEPTTSTEFESRGYYSVYLNNLFAKANNGKNYSTYTEADMQELWARRNDVTEHPDRPWVMIDQRMGRDTYVYYANTDWYHELFTDQHPQQQHNISLSGGNDSVRYFVSAGYNYEEGVVRINPDKLNKLNFRAKIDFDINKYMRFSNNTSYYRSSYFYPGRSSVNQIFSLMTVHALASYPAYNPDGTAIGFTAFADNNYVMDGMWAVLANNGHINRDINDNLLNTTELTIKPLKQVEIKANFTYGFNQARNVNRSVTAPYSKWPGVIEYINKDWALNHLTEAVNTHNYYATNVYATYADTFKEKHNLKVMAGFNWETKHLKDLSAKGYYLMSETLYDLALVGTGEDGTQRLEVGGGQNAYELAGFFARANYDYMGKYLFEISGRYDGTSRFASGSRWGFFPSASAGWRISEESFFKPAKNVIENLKVRYSYGSLGNQQVGYNDYIRTISLGTQDWIFGTASQATYASIGAPVSSSLTWEVSEQHNLGMDMAFLDNRLSFTGETYIRDTKNMLTAGKKLPAAYGASVPKMNAADLRTKGYELSLGWRDMFQLAGKPFSYNVNATFSDYVTDITKFDNPTNLLSDKYVGQRWGEIWGYVVDGLFESDEAAAEYTSRIDCSYVGKAQSSAAGDEARWRGGDLIFRDLDGNGKIDIGSNVLGDSGDRKVIGNTQPRYNYGINLGFQWFGFDFSIFFQGIGKMDWYPVSNTIMFWGPYARPYASLMPKDFHTMIWSEDNKDAYYPRPRGYSANTSNAQLNVANTLYLQDISYCRLKNLTIGYTLPKKWTDKAKLNDVRFYFSGENLHYWAPGFYSDYIDPEMAQYGQSTMRIYPWQKSFLFGIDLSF